MKFNFLLTVFLFSFLFCQAQDAKSIKIGVLPVLSVNKQYQKYAETVKAAIINELSKKKRFAVIDRTQTQNVQSELNIQKYEDYLKSDYIVQQGKSWGAGYLIACNISSIASRRYQEEEEYEDNNGRTRKKRVSMIETTASINIEVLEVETGALKEASATTLTNSFSAEYKDRGSEESNLMQSFGGEISGWLNKVFPVPMKIVQIKSFNKKGLPETVLTTGGTQMNLDQKSTFAISDIPLFSSKTQLIVYVIEYVNVDGKNIPNPQNIGLLKVESTTDEFAVCKVKEGAEKIKEYFDNKTPLYIRVK